MINCPVCGHSMSSTALACPSCGHVMPAAANATPVAAAPTHHTRADDAVHNRGRKRVGAGRWLAGLFFLALLVLIALWYFDVVNFV